MVIKITLLPCNKGYPNRQNQHTLTLPWQRQRISFGWIFGYTYPKNGAMERGNFQGVYLRITYMLLQRNFPWNEIEIQFCQHFRRGVPWCNKHCGHDELYNPSAGSVDLELIIEATKPCWHWNDGTWVPDKWGQQELWLGGHFQINWGTNQNTIQFIYILGKTTKLAMLVLWWGYSWRPCDTVSISFHLCGGVYPKLP